MYINIKYLKDLFLVLMISLLSFGLFAQEAPQVKGVVMDAVTGQPLAGVMVSVPGLFSAITNDEGEFEIKIPHQNATLIFVDAGYQIKEVAVKGRSEINVSLFEEGFNSIYDLAYLPTGIQPLNKSIGSVSSINTNNKWKSSAEGIESFLQGKIAGLNITRRSGVPGMGANMILRGYSSLYTGNQPLIVVDGMIYDVNNYGNSMINGFESNPFSLIDVRDIDNITVLKDGTSLYGSKGANGVVLIRTSHAEDLATKIDFAMYGGVNYAPKNLPIMGADAYRVYLSDILHSKGLTSDEIQSLPYMNDDPSYSDYYNYHNNTNWQNEVFNNSYNQNVYLKVTGGDNIAKYALSLGYMNHSGIIKNNDMNRYNTRFNADLRMSEKFTVNANLAFSYVEQNVSDQGFMSNTNPVYLSLIKAPFLSPNLRDENGETSPNISPVDIFNTGNPKAVVQNMVAMNHGYRFFGSVNFNYVFSDKFSINSLVGLNYDKARESVFIPRWGIASDTLRNAIAESKMKHQVQRLFSLYNDSRFTYQQTFKQVHHVRTSIGFRFSDNQSESDFGMGYNSATDELKSVGTGVNALRSNGGGIGDWRWLNYYAVADYSLWNKYFLSMNLGIDGSSRFGAEVDRGMDLFSYRFGVFPSVGVAWIASSEEFMSGINMIEMLKFRMNYSVTGNDDIGNYSTKQTYRAQNLWGFQGLVRNNIHNPALGWETNKGMNAGVDLALFNERLAVSMDLYKKRTDNMIIYEPLKVAVGLDEVIANSGSMENKGIELGVNGRIINGQFKWDVGFNIAFNESKILSLPVESIVTEYAGAKILTKTGKSAAKFIGYKSDGIIASDEEAASLGLNRKLPNGTLVPFEAGDVKFIDYDGNRIIDENDMVVIGSLDPESVGMISNSFKWKRFSLDALFTFVYGNDIYNAQRARLESLEGVANQSLNANNRWAMQEEVTSVPRANWTDPLLNSRFSDRWIEDGSYLRLQNLSISYEMPLNSRFFKYAHIYATGTNLFTLTNYLGYDPEVSASNSIFEQGIDIGMAPVYKSILMGVRIGL